MTNFTPSYERLVKEAPIGIFQVVIDPAELGDQATGDGNSDVEPEEFYVNEALADLLGFESAEQLRSESAAVEYADPEDEVRVLDQVLDHGNIEGFETAFVTREGKTIDVLLSGTFEDGEFTGFLSDITDRKRLERKTADQAEAILELSTPIVQIWEGITLATVVGTLDTNRAQQLTEELLTGITENDSDVALVDITGVPNVDTATARHLIDTVQAVSLLGSEVIITGINPEIAQTLVQLGITMDDIRTKSSLSEGLKLGLSLTHDEIAVSAVTE